MKIINKLFTFEFTLNTLRSKTKVKLIETNSRLRTITFVRNETGWDVGQSKAYVDKLCEKIGWEYEPTK